MSNEAIERLEKGIWNLPTEAYLTGYDDEFQEYKRVGVSDLTTLIASHRKLEAEVEAGRAVKEFVRNTLWISLVNACWGEASIGSIDLIERALKAGYIYSSIVTQDDIDNEIADSDLVDVGDECYRLTALLSEQPESEDKNE